MEQEKVICNQVHVCGRRPCMHKNPHKKNEFCVSSKCYDIVCKGYCVGLSQLKDGNNN